MGSKRKSEADANTSGCFSLKKRQMLQSKQLSKQLHTLAAKQDKLPVIHNKSLNMSTISSQHQ